MEYVEIKEDIGECLICFDPMNKKKDKLIFCKYCSKYVHKKCYDLWSQQDICQKNTCVYCQQKGGLKKKNTNIFNQIKKKLCFF